MKSKISKITSLILVFSLISFSLISGFVSANVSSFSDLSPEHWCYEKIMKFLDKDYVCGYEDGTFRADRTITRAEYVKIVNNFFGYSENKDLSKINFSDVSENHWFAGYVAEAVERGYITGYPDGTFRPNEPIRRQEATVILSRILDIDEEEYPVDHVDGMAQYSDADEIEEWAYVAIHSYSVYNFINGYPDGTIRLLQNVTRAETVELLNLLEEKIVIDREDKDDSDKKPGGGGPSLRYVFYYNDGQEIVGYRTKVNNGKSALVKPMSLKKESYEFAGWKLRGTDKIYQPGSSTGSITKNLEFDAVWTEIYYNINYDANGGENAPSGDSVRYNNSYEISSKLPTSGDYTFVGWQESGDTEIYVAKDVIANVLKDYNLLALWTKLGIEVEPDTNTTPSGEGIPGQEQEDYELVADNITMYVGEVEELIAKLNPEHSKTKYTWKVKTTTNNAGSGKNYISLSGDGIEKESGDVTITALNPTKANKPVELQITAVTEEGFELTRTVFVTVLDREVGITTPENPQNPSDNSTIDVIANDLYVKVGEKKDMTITLNPDAKIKEIEWLVSEGSKNIEIFGSKSGDAIIENSNSGDTVVIRGLEVTNSKKPAKVKVTVEINGALITEEVKVHVEPIEVTINHVFMKDDVIEEEKTTKTSLSSINDSIDVSEEKYNGNDINMDWYAEPKVSGDSIIKFEEGKEVYESTLVYDRLLAEIIFDGNESTSGDMDSQFIHVGSGDNLDANKYVKEGYTFKGWAESKNGEVVAKDEAIYTPEKAGEIKLYAIWTADEYTLTYEYNGATGGNSKKNDKFATDEKLTDLPKPTKTSHEFAGWYHDEKLTDKVESTDTMPAKNKTIYAKWNWTPKITAKLESNFKDGKGETRAVPGDTITYTLTITNKENEDLELNIDFDDTDTEVDKTVSIKAGETTTVTVTRKVPNGYDVAGEPFELTGDVTVKDKGARKSYSDPVDFEASNLIEKNISLLSKEPKNKNIVILLDLSGSMEYCFKHETNNTNKYRFPESIVDDPAEFFFMESSKPGGNKILQPENGYYYSQYAYLGHQYIDTDGQYKQCPDQHSRLDVAKESLIQFVKDIYEASKENNEQINIRLIGFSNRDWEDTVKMKLDISNCDKINDIKAYYNTDVLTALTTAVNQIQDKNANLDNAESYLIFFGDGLSTESDPDYNYNNVKNNFDYIYPIGLGNSFDDSNGNDAGLKTLLSFAKDTNDDGVIDKKDVTVATTAQGVKTAFKDITTKIINKVQSSNGEVSLNMTKNPNYFSVLVTHEITEGGKQVDKKLFEIKNIMEPGSTIQWSYVNDEMVEVNVTTRVEATTSKLYIDFSGNAFSDKENIKVILGKEAGTVLTPNA